MNEFLKIFFNNYEIFDTEITENSFISKFSTKIIGRNETFEKQIKLSKTEIEKLFYAFYYLHDFFDIFVFHLNNLGFKVTGLATKDLKVLLPLQKIIKYKLVKMEKNDNFQKVIIVNHLNMVNIQLPKDVFDTKDLEEIILFFEFANISIKYFEAFANGDMEMRKIIERKLLVLIPSIIK